MTAPTDSSPTTVSSDPRAEHAVDAFRDALIRMRDGEELTVEDLNTTADLLQMVQAPTGDALAAAAMPHFRDVFHSGRDSGTLSGPARISIRKERTDVVH
ncbi:hypothetical protein [Streptomyces sp. NBC_01578]|uniref:hypothetical protein n=1 Tax=Streptomyces sp. NBC_01578 TaxID=2975884 RepID=UPI00386803E0